MYEKCHTQNFYSLLTNIHLHPLFRVADKEAREAAIAQNGEYLIQKYYRAKKYEFLVLNPEALEGDEIDITFFDNVPLEFELKERTKKHDGRYIWEGQNEKLKEGFYKHYGIDDDEALPEDKKTKKYISDQFSSINIATGVVQEFIDENGVSFYRQKGFSSDVDLSIPSNNNPKETRVASINFQYVISGAKYFIEQLPNTPSVHLLIEFDKENFQQSYGHGPTTEEARGKYRARQAKYHAYLRRNGYGYLIKEPDPEGDKKRTYEYVKRNLIKLPDSATRARFYKKLESHSQLNQSDVEKLIAEVESHLKSIKEQSSQQ